MKKVVICLSLVIVLMLTSFGTTVNAYQSDKSFTYDEFGPVPATNAYQVKSIIDENVMGTTRMSEPSDIFIDDNDQIYILDSGNCRVLILDKTYTCIQELSEFKYNGEILTLAEKAQGLFYRESTKLLYIADTENDRVIVTDLQGNVSKIYEKPVTDQLSAEMRYKPRKIIVDNMGIMYVTSASVNTGALLIDSTNTFLGFYGTNKVEETAAMKAERFWRALFNVEQFEQSFQPVEFNNIFWTDDRFVYTVNPVNSTVRSAIVKLNALGENVLPGEIDFYEIQYNTVGMLSSSDNEANLMFPDITVDSDGVMTVIERKKGRLYQFDAQCNLISVFGGMGYQEGLFQGLNSIECDSDGDLYVLDDVKNSVTVLTPTHYGQMIRVANQLYNEGRYIESIEPWNEVLKMNSNYTMAYVGMGKAYMSLGEYEKAMEYFKIGREREEYGDAKDAFRTEIIRENFGLVAVVVILLLLLILGYETIADWIYRLLWSVKRKRRDKR